MKADDLLAHEPFNMDVERKKDIFFDAIKEAIVFHYEHCEKYKIFCEKKEFNPHTIFMLHEIPLLPVSVFKSIILQSVPNDKIIKTLHSSSTSGQPSTIPLDEITAKRQIRAMTSIMSNFIGKGRKIFIVLDNQKTVASSRGDLSSRGTAIRSMMPFAKQMHYVLDENLKLNLEKLKTILKSIKKDDETCIFGFTYLIHSVAKEIEKNKEVLSIFKELKKPFVVHIGGWKKLQELNIDKNQFTGRLEKLFSTERKKILDFYGMTEQLGTIYPDCEYGLKHVPLYSEIIIRDIETLDSVENGKEGFIQLLSPLPHSYPGISILSDDLGIIIDEGGCKCGRLGKAFLFRGRAKKAEIKGCGDTLRLE